MLKVYLVDDEFLILEELKNLVDWQSLGYELCGLSVDPKKAKEQILALKPHLVISDILMSPINGLELAEQVKKVYPEIDFCFLTAFDYFDYAVKALRIGADDYLLKPIITEDLINTLNKIKNKKTDAYFSRIFEAVLIKNHDIESGGEDDDILAGDVRYNYLAVKEGDYAGLAKKYGKYFIFSYVFNGFCYIVSQNFDAAKLKKYAGENKIYAAAGDAFSNCVEAAIRLRQIKNVIWRYTKQLNRDSENDNVLAAAVIGEIIKDIERNYKEDLTINLYAEKYFYSLNYLSKIFTKLVGCSFTKYLIDFRMEKAKQLLKKNELTLSGVAFNVGYSNYCHFSKIFKKYVGCSPQKYRNLNI